MQDPAAWDSLVLSHPGATFFHTSAWARVLHESYKFTPLYLMAGPPSSVLHPPSSLLALMEVQSPLTGRRGVSLPFTDLCPPLVSEQALRMFLDDLTAISKVRRWNYWECRGIPGPPDGVQPSVTFHGHTLDLSIGAEALFAGCKSPVRTAIRKAGQAGLQVESSATLEALRIFYVLHCRTRRKHGLPPQPFGFFRAIHRHVLSRGLGQVVVASKGPTPVAASVYFHHGNRAIYKYGASDDAFQDLRGSNLVMWQAIQSYAKDSFQSLHFGRTSLAAEGLRRFKLGWGCREEPIYYLRYDCRQARFVAGKDEAFGWYNSLMARMPILFLRLLGACLYRHIA